MFIDNNTTETPGDFNFRWAESLIVFAQRFR